MKNLIIAVLCFSAWVQQGNAQNISINQDGSQPDTSAMLDISSSNKGLLIPRMTTAQQGAIALPANGLLMYNSSINAFQANVGSAASPNWSTLAMGKERYNYVLVKSA